MIRLPLALLLAIGAGAAGTRVQAQPMDHAMPGMAMPAETDPHANHNAPTADSATSGEDSVGTDQQPGSAAAPHAPTDRYADRFWPPEAMARSRDTLAREHGGMAFSQVRADILELQPRSGGDAYRWDAEGWFGGDIHRLMITTEGEGRTGEGVERAEVQALYGRALDAYWNLRAGVRQDLGRDPRRTYAVIGIEGLAPYWFEVEGSLFLSNKGDLLARVEAYYDQRLTQRLILQPRMEIDASAQNIAETGTGRGLSEASFDLRLRYEVKREFAPYVGVSWERLLGHTANYARAADESRGGLRLVLGVRSWF